MDPLDDEFVTAIFAIRGHGNTQRSAATYKACGSNLDATLKFLSFVREKRRLDAQYCKRREVKEERHLKVLELKSFGYTDRAAFLALSNNSWDHEKALSFLESKYNRKVKKDKASDQSTKEYVESRKKANAKNKSKKAPPSTFEVEESILEKLEQETLCNRATCKRVYTECSGDGALTRSHLHEHRRNIQQRILRSDIKKQARNMKEENLQKLVKLTSYTVERCRKILEHFDGDYEKAERQYNKFTRKKQKGDKIELDNTEDNLMTDFRIQELELSERRDLEQYFFSRDTLIQIVKVFDNFDNPCCMVCPSVAHASHYLNRELVLLDIDERFSYLPRYFNYNLYRPSPLTQKFDMILFDPPYFQVPMPDLVNSVDVVAQHDTDTALVVAFLRRSELSLLQGFSKYRLHASGYHPGYAHVKPTKRRNYMFYTNWDGLPRNSDELY